ncbi:hypothetical protein CMI40_02750 [Candidatus Pacearchaeota archaeon]|jgi:DNA-binding NtrC family response regulator|nr:hypothetical protein [Candidatus Pacearchaeota archaeon]|tara:strand:- start:5357 stop:5575 length:219 start_codon:yes stop_codon:yes gene_type:complete
MYPGPLGSEIIKKFSRHPEFEDIPFILLYAGDVGIGKEAVENGAFGYLIKPFGSKDLVNIAHKALDSRKKKN